MIPNPFQSQLKAHRWLIARRLSQVGVLALFLLGPITGIWVVKGNLSASMTLGVLPLTDPFLLLQSVLSGGLPVTSGVVGALIVLVFYALVGGRVFCSWVCPVNPVTDAAAWLRRRFDLRGNSALSRNLRYWLLGLALLFPLLTGVLVWEYINPVSMFQRGLIFGMGWAWTVILALFLFDLFIAKHGWCGRLCPMGAFYGLIGSGSIIRVCATARDRCDDCMDCFGVCPEPQVIKPALKGAAAGVGPVILDRNCTNCGRCIETCPQGVFRFGTRMSNGASLF
ncbi:quinol dehydrogenase ferredoxin subunit NapH [Candidatus Thiosymbion oneisti]|uniref:quinol dehydrogenase ferredoxin subunit NapH n=1 Tax=Candidatus Thiosymbion oneisti TaxID=589554 RepID=UPI000B326BCC|nr:quinol dehydrogenase ferredoxin subunit NapH [Candidatus Thiosymbion oneisti]